MALLSKTPDFNQLKCFLCTKYLSVPPIFILPNNLFVCGRCDIPKGQSFTRHSLFENVAVFLLFPCNNSGCLETLKWGHVTQHELYCQYREIRCCICQSSYEAGNVMKHFQQKHPNNLFIDEDLMITKTQTYGEECSAAFLVSIKSLKFMVFLELKSFLIIKVVPLAKLDDPYYFDVNFDAENHTVNWKNQQIIECLMGDDWLEHQYDISHMKRTKYLKIQLIIYDYNKKECNTKPEYSYHSVQEVIAPLLECPVCLQIMKDKIEICKKGHSVCVSCKAKLLRCHLCRSEFVGTRNFSLETMSSNLEQFLM
ncbi:uncharacterized protein [Euwallacea similis]|uniref:uncharacterized protein n=1 Tax=Euwallacea similis TaxID=1736056 RepID=UPI00344B30D6